MAVDHRQCSLLAFALGASLAVATAAAPGAAKEIHWYTERCGPVDRPANATLCAEAVEFATVTNPALVDGIMPCCGMVEVDCATGLLAYPLNSTQYDFSGFAPFLAAGKAVTMTLQGTGGPTAGGACCASADDCPMQAHKEELAQQLLALALKWKFTSFTGDWEWRNAGTFHFAGWNATMAHIASVLKPHGVGLGNGIVAGCTDGFHCRDDDPANTANTDPCCCPAYRATPWADVLSDMGSYAIGPGLPAWMKTGVKGHCPKHLLDPPVIEYCGWEGGLMNVLNSPRWPRRPNVAPALWIGACDGSGTTAHGWTQPKLHAFLAFLDTQGMRRVGLWCMTDNGDPIGFPCHVESCPWFYAELEAWKARG